MNDAQPLLSVVTYGIDFRTGDWKGQPEGTCYVMIEEVDRG
jgi:hypothetical protein